MATRRVIGDLRFRLGASIDGLKKSIAEAKKEFKSLAKEGQNLGKGGVGGLGNVAALAKAGGPLSLLAVAAGVAAGSVAKTTAALDDLGKKARAANVDSEFLAGIRVQATRSGVEVIALDVALQKLTKNLTDAKLGGGEGAKGFGLLGIDPNELESTEDAFFAIADSFKSMEGNGQAIAGLLKLFEEAGPRFATLFLQGSESLKDAVQATRDSGRATEDAIAAAEKLTTEWAKIRGSVSSLSTDIGNFLIPGLAEALERFNDLKLLTAPITGQGARSFADAFFPTTDVAEIESQIDGIDEEIKNLEFTLEKHRKAVNESGVAWREMAGAAGEFIAQNRLDTALIDREQALVRLAKAQKNVTQFTIEAFETEDRLLRESNNLQARPAAASPTVRGSADAGLEAARTRARREGARIRADLIKKENQLALAQLDDSLEDELKLYEGNYQKITEVLEDFYAKQRAIRLADIDAGNTALNTQIAAVRSQLNSAIDANNGRDNAAIVNLRSQIEKLYGERTKLEIDRRGVEAETERQLEDARQAAFEKETARFAARADRIRELQRAIASEGDDPRQANQLELEAFDRRIEKIKNLTDAEKEIVFQRRQQLVLLGQLDEIEAELEATSIVNARAIIELQAEYNQGLIGEAELQQRLIDLEKQRIDNQENLLRESALVNRQLGRNNEANAIDNTIQESATRANEAIVAAQEQYASMVEGSVNDFFADIRNESVSTSEAIRNIFIRLFETLATQTAANFAKSVGDSFAQELRRGAEEGKGAASDLADHAEREMGGAANSISAAFKRIFSGSGSTFSKFASYIAGLFGGGTDASIAAQAAGAATGGFVSGGRVRGYAGGGEVTGPGTAISDSILAYLANGEYVQPAKSVQHYGKDFHEALKNLALPKGALRAMAGLDKIPQALTKAAEKPKHFAVGGLAGTGPVRNRSDFGMVPVSVQMTSVGTPQRVTQQRQDVNEQGDLVIQFLIDDLQRNGPYNQARNSDQRYRRRGR